MIDERTATVAPPATAERNAESFRPVPGQRLVDRYTVLQALGEGGMGLVVAAYDERLNRRVALKLLAGKAERETNRHEHDEHEARLVREAQAMARLNHPNVVAVYDSGRLEQGTFFIAMEFVEGQTLGAWCQESKRTWKDIVQAYVQAARGLGAAHAVGLIHRDFKPLNVLVSREGRVLVTDFGIARADDSTPEESPGPMAPTEAWSTPLTVPGLVVGTAKYMAPELFQGQVADVRSDVFAFCVALYEALYEQPAFSGDSQAEKLEAKAAGRFAAVPSKSPVPAWVGRAVMQGLAANPLSRPASILALVQALEDDPQVKRRARLRMALSGAVTLVVGSATSVAWMQSRGPGCHSMERRLTDVWDASVKGKVKAALMATGLSYAADVAPRLEQVLDGYAASWVKMSEEVCEASGTGANSNLAVLREACLERKRTQLRTLTELLSAGPDVQLLSKAVQAAGALPPVEYCADARALTARVPPPEEPVLRAEVDRLQEKVERLATLFEAGKSAEGLAQAQEVLHDVERVDYAPLKAQALYVTARLEEGAGQYPAAEARIRKAIPLASRGGDALTHALAWNLLSNVVGYRQARFDDALGLELTMESALESADDARARGSALNTLGLIFAHKGKHQEALDRIERSLELRKKTFGAIHPDVAQSESNMGLVYFLMGKFPEALERFSQSLELREKILGSAHPEVAQSLNNVGAMLFKMGRCQEALPRHQRALVIQTNALGPEHPDVAASRTNLGSDLQCVHRYAEALEQFELSLKLQEKALGPTHPNVGGLLNNLGLVYGNLGRDEEALLHHRRALTLWKKAFGDEHPNVFESLFNQGDVLRRLHKTAEAIELHEYALAHQEKLFGADNPDVALTLRSLGRDLTAAGRLSEAYVIEQRSLQIFEKTIGPHFADTISVVVDLGQIRLKERRKEDAWPFLERASKHLSLVDAEARDHALAFSVAEALWAVGKEKKQAIVFAQEARDWWLKYHLPQAAEAIAWLESHRLGSN